MASAQVMFRCWSDISANIPGGAGENRRGKILRLRHALRSSEQTLVAEKSLREPILAALKANRAHRCDIPQTAALARLLITKNFGTQSGLRAGQAPEKIAEDGGF